MRFRPALTPLAGCAALLVSMNAAAQDVPLNNQSATLDGGAVSGAVGANIVAGNANQQANVGVIASGEVGLGTGSLSQALVAPSLAPSSDASASIADGAFAGSSGWLAANVGAGQGNQQGNLAVIGISLSAQAATAATLSQSRASTVAPPAADDPDNVDRYRAHLGEGSFEASSGLVQVNVAAGDGNTSANVFALTVPGQ